MLRLSSGGLVAAIVVLLAGCRHEQLPTPLPPPPVTTATVPVTTQAAPPPPPRPLPPPPASAPFSWRAAGAFVWHETDVDPTRLGLALRRNGFGWVAVFLHDGRTEDPVDSGWIERFRAASGLAVGGWGVLRSEPEAEAELADALLTRYGLAFYVADAESEYEFSGVGGPSHERAGRSRRFVKTFRARRPGFPAGVTSYCRADMHDIDWASWRGAGFAFLPQAYVNEFGRRATPATCVHAAERHFPPADVHPLIGMYASSRPVAVETYVRLLARAPTQGFSVYLAETVADEQWDVFGRGISEHALARWR